MARLVYRLLLLAFLFIGGNCFAVDYTGRIVGVLDGDTIDLLTADKELVRVRLSGIDAPEKHQPFGNAAKKALSDIAFNRQAVVSGKKHDRYGRFVGRVIVSGEDANLQMLKDGFAWHYKKYEREQSAAERLSYSDAEAAARQQKLGLWKDTEPVAPWDFRASRRGGSFRELRGVSDDSDSEKRLVPSVCCGRVIGMSTLACYLHSKGQGRPEGALPKSQTTGLERAISRKVWQRCVKCSPSLAGCVSTRASVG